MGDLEINFSDIFKKFKRNTNPWGVFCDRCGGESCKNYTDGNVELCENCLKEFRKKVFDEIYMNEYSSKRR